MKVVLYDDKGNRLAVWHVPDDQVDCGGQPECIADWVVLSGELIYGEDDDEES